MDIIRESLNWCWSFFREGGQVFQIISNIFGDTFPFSILTICTFSGMFAYLSLAFVKWLIQ